MDIDFSKVQGGAPQGPQITEQMVRDAKTVECPCGGMVFAEKMMFKKISPIISPTGKEELFPLNLVVCEKCGKVPIEFNPHNIIPDELIATELIK